MRFEQIVKSAYHKTFEADVKPPKNTPPSTLPGKLWFLFFIIPLRAIDFLFKLFTEFPLTLLTESTLALADRLNSISSKSDNKGWRNFIFFAALLVSFLHFLLQIPRILVRLVSSPKTSYYEAYKLHPLLGCISAAASITAYAIIVFFMAPIILPAVVASPIVTALGLWGLTTPGIIPLGFFTFFCKTFTFYTITTLCKHIYQSHQYRKEMREQMARTPAANSNDDLNLTPPPPSSYRNISTHNRGFTPHTYRVVELDPESEPTSASDKEGDDSEGEIIENIFHGRDEESASPTP